MKKKAAKPVKKQAVVVPDLLPCPFCSGKAVLNINPWGIYVECVNKKCGAVGPNVLEMTSTYAIKLWNNRK